MLTSSLALCVNVSKANSANRRNKGRYNLDVQFNNGSVKRYYVTSNTVVQAMLAKSFGKFFNENLKGARGRFLITAKRAKVSQ